MTQETTSSKPKHNLIGDTVLRKDFQGIFYLMSHPEKGWDSASIRMESEQQLLDTFNVKLGEWKHDKFSEYRPVFKVDPE